MCRWPLITLVQCMFIRIVSKLYGQIVGIPMGTNCAFVFVLYERFHAFSF